MKTNQLFLLTTCIILFFMSGKNESSMQEILKKTTQHYQSQKSISYSVNFLLNDDKDTVSNKLSCKMERVDTDTIFGGKIWFDYKKYNAEVYYDLKNVYVINHQNRKIEVSNPHSRQSNVIGGNFVGHIIETYFLKPKELYSLTQDTIVKISIADFIKNEVEYWEVSILHPDREIFTDQTKKIFINKTNYNIEKISTNYKIQNEKRFEILDLANIKFNQNDFAEIDDRVKELLDKYHVEIRTNEDENQNNLLVKGTIAPNFDGTHFQTNKDIKLYSFQNKVIVLDFWYRSCYPCIKAIPHLNELYKEYKEDGLIVLGINSKDTKEKDKKKLPAFIEKNQVSYPIILTDKKTDRLYKVKAYPSLYVLNDNKEVIFTQIGFNENLKDTLKKVIDKEIHGKL